MINIYELFLFLIFIFGEYLTKHTRVQFTFPVFLFFLTN
jgi:uncharacterized membrane protein YjjP (DUF1212 family)